MNEALNRANIVALALPGALMAGAYGSQYIGGLSPCEMCIWQRWAHLAAIALAVTAFRIYPPIRRLIIVGAALAIIASGLIGVFHAGVEYGWWPGLTTCATAGSGSLADIMAAPLVRCDVPQWQFAGISLAGFNAIFSILGSITIFQLVRMTR